MKVRDEINKFALEENKTVLHWLFDRYHWSQQWSFVAKCTHQRYGYRSYETNRVWAPTIEGVAIYKQLREVEK